MFIATNSPGSEQRLRVDLSRPWQLEGGLLAVATPPLGGLLACVTGCGDLECADQHLGLQLYDVPDGVRMEAWLEETKLVMASTPAPGGTPLGCVQLHLPSGALQAEAIEPPVSEETTSRLARSLCGELLDVLHERWLALKGVDVATSATQVPSLETGSWIWQDLHPLARFDEFHLKGRNYIACEQYCPDPACQCREARVVFQDVDLKTEIGIAYMSSENGSVVESKCEAGQAALLRNLIAEYASRYRRLGQRLGDRYRAVKVAGKRGAVITRPRPAPRVMVGRNDPCPCGSNRKFKKCCLDKQQPGSATR